MSVVAKVWPLMLCPLKLKHCKDHVPGILEVSYDMFYTLTDGGNIGHQSLFLRWIHLSRNIYIYDYIWVRNYYLQ